VTRLAVRYIRIFYLLYNIGYNKKRAVYNSYIIFNYCSIIYFRCTINFRNNYYCSCFAEIVASGKSISCRFIDIIFVMLAPVPAHENKIKSHTYIHTYYYQIDNTTRLYDAILRHHTHIHGTSRTYVHGISMSVDPVREILLLTNGAAEIDNRPNNPIPYIPPIPIPMKYICAYLRPNSHGLRYIIIIMIIIIIRYTLLLFATCSL